MNGCVKANNDTELFSLISDSQGVGGDGQVRLCPGIVDFENFIPIPLTKSITIICAGVGTKDMCILDGHGVTNHFYNDSGGFGGLTFAFIGLIFINGSGGFSTSTALRYGGGSLYLVGSTNIIQGSLFYNNRATSSSSSAVSII